MPVRIAICEGTPSYSRALGAFLRRDPSLEVVGTFATAEALLGALDTLEPDLITINLELAGMDGLDAIGRIMQERPRPILVVSGHGAKSDRAAEALAAGALEAIEKSTLRLHEPDDLWATALRSRIKRLASARPSPVPRPRLGPASGPLTAIGIAASTGGPQALATILATVPAGFTLPVLVVQHITAGFAPGLISWLDRLLALPVGVAEDGAPALPGVWFAPDDTHLGLDGQGRFALDAHTQRGAHRPSADMLFESLAAGAGETALGIVLTGMGRDGAQGVRALRAAGATVVAQDEESCAVFGMPRAAVEAGADRVLSLAEIAALLCGLRAGATV